MTQQIVLITPAGVMSRPDGTGSSRIATTHWSDTERADSLLSQFKSGTEPVPFHSEETQQRQVEMLELCLKSGPIAWDARDLDGEEIVELIKYTKGLPFFGEPDDDGDNSWLD